MEWSSYLETGVDEIDRQHRGLLERINLFRKRMEDNDIEIEREMGEVISFLVDYVNYHFITEETIMEREGYPELYLQKKEHRELTGKLSEILGGLKEGRAYKPEELYLFLTEWLNNHIIRSDLDLGTFLKSRTQKSDSKYDSSESFYDFYLSGLRERLSSLPGSGQELLKVYLGNLYSSLVIPNIESYSHVLFSLDLLKERGLVRSREELQEVKRKFLENHSPETYPGGETVKQRIREYLVK